MIFFSFSDDSSIRGDVCRDLPILSSSCSQGCLLGVIWSPHALYLVCTFQLSQLVNVLAILGGENSLGAEDGMCSTNSVDICLKSVVVFHQKSLLCSLHLPIVFVCLGIGGAWDKLCRIIVPTSVHMAGNCGDMPELLICLLHL